MDAGSAYVDILPSLKNFSGELGKQLDPEAKKAGESAGKEASEGFGSKFKDAAKEIVNPLTVAMSAAGAIEVFKGFIESAREAQKVTALTAQVIKSTGDASDLTAGEVAELGKSISEKTGIDHIAIQSGENLLLTFKNIKNEAGAGNDIFTQTTSIMTDMSVALGQDMKTSSIQLGKALNDPIKGIAQLSRVGVTFTTQQKDLIASLVKSGDTMGAQKVILKELSSEFGGAAEAAATPMSKLKVTLGDLGEQIGLKLIPFIDGAASAILKAIPVVEGLAADFSAMAQFIQSNATVFAVVAGIIATIFIPHLIAMGVEATVSAAKSVAAWLADSAGAIADAAVHSAAVVAIVAGWVLMGAQSLLAAAKVAAAWIISMGPIALVIAAVVGLVVLIIKNWGTIKEVTVEVWGAVSSFVMGIVNDVVGFIKDHWQLLVAILTGPIGAAVVLIATHWGTIKTDAEDAFNWVKGKVETIFGDVVTFLSTSVTNIVGFFTGLPGKIESATVGLFDGIKDAFKEAINFVIDGWNSLKFSIPSIDTHIPGVGKIGGGSFGVPQIPRLASGGIVNTPTIALVGEAGPEAVIPLSKLNDIVRGTGGHTVTVNNYGKDVGPATIVAGLSQYETLHGRAAFAGIPGLG